VRQRVVHIGLHVSCVPHTVERCQGRLKVDYVAVAVANKDVGWGHIAVHYEAALYRVGCIANSLLEGESLAHVTC
jgi:hypothetical protein